MWIRRRTYHLLGTTYSTATVPHPMLLAPQQISESCPVPLVSHGGFSIHATNPEGPCKLNRSPWELLDDLTLSDPQEVDDLLDSYYVNMDSCACHLSSTSMPITSMNNKEMMAMATTSNDIAQLQTLKKKTTLKKATMKKKEVQTQKNTNVKKEKGEEGAAQTWKCNKNDGKGWKCSNNASCPNSLCEYHLMKKHSYLNLEFASTVSQDKVMVLAPTKSSKPCNSSNTQKKKPINNYDATQGFYYYSGFGPSHGKRCCRNNLKKEVDVEVEPSKCASPLSHGKVKTGDGTNNGATTCSDDACNNNNFGCCNTNMERNKNPWKLLRKHEGVGTHVTISKTS